MWLINADNLAPVLIAFGTLVSALLTGAGATALVKRRKEPAPVGTADAAIIALAENTKAMQEMNRQFTENNNLFRSMGISMGHILGHIEATRHINDAARDHLSAIRDATMRGAR